VKVDLRKGAAAPEPGKKGAGIDSHLYGPLFVDVQMKGVFKDGKTFVDAEPKHLDPASLCRLYVECRDKPGFSLADFVNEHFNMPHAPRPIELPRADPHQDIRSHIRQLWSDLVRTSGDAGAGSPTSTILPLPHAYVVPGGRFREIYYWDSYFTILGLVEDGRGDLAEGMLKNFAALIDTYGHIPNGNRSYFLNRSQPPFFFKMVECVCGEEVVAGFAAYLPQLEREYAYWMTGEDALAPGEAHAHLVRLPDGSLLNRFWDALDEPREESYRDDVHTAQSSDRPASLVYRDLRAAAESGWDFSSRWFADPARIDTVETTAILPVDLNAILWGLENAIAAGSEHRGDLSGATQFRARAARRAKAIDLYLWSDGLGHYVDYNWQKQDQKSSLNGAVVVPLYFGLASDQKARAVADIVGRELLKKNGLATTLVDSGQQWDFPNGWAPLQWMAVEGLGRYGHDELGREITRRWLALVSRIYLETGKLLEKYNVIETSEGGGGEYPTQDGFGWTNGTFVAMAKRYPDLAGA
jgi:alpha,alpha-trehalase